MRAIAGQENAVLNAPDGHSVHVRVWVWDGAAYQNVAALEGRNWLVSVDWDESVNEPCAQATVQMRRRLEDLSLNPLVSNKLTGLLALARPFVIETATIPLGDPPEESDYREVFRGIVETIAMDKDPISFTGRDMAGPLLRAYIENEAEYGSDSGVAVETIIQSILTAAGTGVTLYVPTATGVVFGRFKQKKAAVLTAVRELALKIGWDLRYLWDDGTSTFRLTLFEPDRAATTSVWTFQPHKVKSVTKLTQTLFDVRNAIRLYFYNRSAADAAGVAPLALVVAEDPASQTAYGRQYMQMAEPEDSPIDSTAEAQVMVNAALADLKNPLLDFGVEVGFHYAVQLGDMLTFAADDLHFSNPQTLAVVSAAHRIDGRGHRTSLQLRGKPVGANDAWLARDGRVRMLAQPPGSAPDPVGSLTATATAGGAVITFTRPTVAPVPVEYELHVATTSGFTPNLGTLREKADRTNFEVSGLAPGSTYYAQVVGRDSVGNRSSAVQVSFSPRYVEPRVMLPYLVPGIIPNDSFEANSLVGFPPDTWAMTVGTWGVSAQTTTTAYSGSYAVQMNGGVASELTSQMVTAREGDVVTYEAIAMRPTAAGTPLSSIYLEWLNSAAVVVSSVNTLIGYGSAGVWTRDRGASVAPSGTRFMRLRITHSALGSDAVVVDAVRVLYSRFAQENITYVLSPGGGYVTAPSAYERLGYYMSAGSEVVLQGALQAPTPAPGLATVVFTLPVGYRPTKARGFTVASGAGPVYVEVGSTGAVQAAPVAGTILFFDGVRFRPTGS